MAKKLNKTAVMDKPEMVAQEPTAVELPGVTLTAQQSAQQEMDKLKQQILDLQNSLEAERAKKAAARVPRKLTPEQQAIADARAKFEHVELAEVGTVLRMVQDLPRLTQVDATPKLIRMMKHYRVAQAVIDMVNLVVSDTGRDFMDVLTEATTRHSKEDKVSTKIVTNEAEKMLLENLAAEGEQAEQANHGPEGDESDEEAAARAEVDGQPE